ncbi:MAG: response regulator [Candidatus Omnitrophota bacterium]
MKKKILIIDDEELLTKTFSKFLEKKDFEVFIAKKGQDAIDMAEEEMFDLIISDMRMPGLDGIQTAMKLREVFEKKKLKMPPEIFITGYSDENKEMQARALCPVAYIMKPFDVNDLLGAINEALKK